MKHKEMLDTRKKELKGYRTLLRDLKRFFFPGSLREAIEHEVSSLQNQGIMQIGQALDALILIRNLPDPSSSRPLIEVWIGSYIEHTRLKDSIDLFWRTPWDAETPIGQQVWYRIIDMENYLRICLKIQLKVFDMSRKGR